MTLSLEYIICQHSEGEHAHAVKSTVRKNQNPGVTVRVSGSDVTWELLGLPLGEVKNASDRKTNKTRLDFYIGKTDFLQQRARLPIPPTRTRPRGLMLTNPTGTVQKGGTTISWKGPMAKVPALFAQMTFPTGAFECVAANEVLFNIDWERALYPLHDGTRTQIHFGVEAAWHMKRRRGLEAPRAKVVMTMQQFANVLDVLARIK